MKIQKTLIPAFFLLALVVFATNTNQATAAESDAEWLTDFEAAQTKAATEGKPMLLDFTGSDWCGWCIRLKEEVFSREAFVDYANAELVLVRVDFPRKKPQSDALKEQNEALANKYEIRGFPTIVLLSPEGELINTTGYRPGGPESYVAHLQELLSAE